MRQYRLRSIMALIAVIALSFGAGMLMERAKSGPPPRYIAMRRIKQTGTFILDTRPASKAAASEARP